MEIKTLSHIQFKDPAFRCGIFPGVTRLADGSLLMLFVAGDEFESADQHIVQARSCDNGKSWQLDGAIHDRAELNFAMPFNDCAKPTLMENGELLALGYGFFRDRPDMDLSSYAEQFGHFPESKNFTLRSSDNGKSWSRHEFIEHGYIGLETSGPALKLANGELLFFAPPFGVQAGEQIGLCFNGGKDGRVWQEIGQFAHTPDIASWEIRACQLDSGRIVLIIWAFDLKNQRHLNNRICYSDDNGKSWSEPLDIQLPGQASGILKLEDESFFVLQTRREGAECGLFLTRFDLSSSGKLTNCGGNWVMRAGDLASAEGNIERQFCSLKFGQPSMLPLVGNEYLVVYWQAEGDIYQIQSRIVQVS